MSPRWHVQWKSRVGMGILAALMVLASVRAGDPVQGARPGDSRRSSQADLDLLGSQDPDVRRTARTRLMATDLPGLKSLQSGAEAERPEEEVRIIVGIIRELTLSTNTTLGVASAEMLVGWSHSVRPTLATAARAEQQVRHDEATRHFRGLGGTVFSEGAQLREVVLNGTPVRDEDLRWLRGWPRLSDLSLEHTTITDTGIRNLGGLPALEWLNLYRTRIGDEGLRLLGRFSRLKHLPIGSTLASDAGLAHVTNLTALEYLGLRDTDVGDTGASRLGGMKSLRGLHLGGTRLTDSGLAVLSALPGLERLWVDRTEITDEGVPRLLALKNLLELHVDGTRITEAGRQRLRLGLPACRITP